MVVIVWWLDLQLPVQSVFVITKVVSSNPVHSEMYSIQHCMIKFVSGLRQGRGVWNRWDGGVQSWWDESYGMGGTKVHRVSGIYEYGMNGTEVCIELVEFMSME